MRYPGNVPKGAVLLARFPGYPTASGRDSWALYARPAVSAGLWLALKLVGDPDAEHKSNYWLGWNVRELRFNQRNSCARLLEANHGELWFAVKTALEVLVEDLGLRFGDQIRGLTIEPKTHEYRPGFRAMIEGLEAQADPVVQPLKGSDTGFHTGSGSGSDSQPIPTPPRIHPVATPPYTPYGVAGVKRDSLGVPGTLTTDDEDLL